MSGPGPMPWTLTWSLQLLCVETWTVVQLFLEKEEMIFQRDLFGLSQVTV